MKRDKYLEQLLKARDDYADEIPLEIYCSKTRINGEQRSPKYKCRKLWFQVELYYLVEMGRLDGFICEHAGKMFDNFIQYANATNFSYRLTNEEDIMRANKILTAIIEDVQEQKTTEDDSPK